jgi:hypothetical protein
MAPLVARESSRPDWEGPIVYADEDGEPWIYDVADLQRVLDIAAAMLDAEIPEADEEGAGTVDPVDRLASEIDAAAVRRGEEDEGFYPQSVARRIVAMCEALDLAVASLEGFEIRLGSLERLSGYRADIAEAHRGEPWALFRAGCNTQAAAVLEKWGGGEVLVAVEIEDRDGEQYVL